MGSTPDAKAGCWRTRLRWVEGTGSSLAAAPAPSLTVARAPPPLSSARLGLRLRNGRLDASRPERHARAVGHGPGLGHQAVDLDRVALAQARGQAGHLDGQDLGLALAQGDQLDHIQRLAVPIRPWLPGLEVDHRL